MQKTNNLQEIFLTQLRRERRPVTMFLMNGFQMHGSKLLDSLMSGGGITHMLNSIALILCALSMGGL